MTDKFIDRIAELAGRTARVLDSLAVSVEEVGLAPYADTMRRVANEHRKVALDCLVETQPISTRRVSIGRQLRDLAEEAKQVAAELMKRGIPGHDSVSESAMMLEEVADLADRATRE